MLATAFLALALASVAAAKVTVLQTNDDGWAVANIRATNDALNAAGYYNIILSAPSENKSGCVHCSSRLATVLTHRAARARRPPRPRCSTPRASMTLVRSARLQSASTRRTVRSISCLRGEGFYLTVISARLAYVNAYPVDSARYGIQYMAPAFFGSKPQIVLAGPNVGTTTLPV
jgi:5'-nucleotidase